MGNLGQTNFLFKIELYGNIIRKTMDVTITQIPKKLNQSPLHLNLCNYMHSYVVLQLMHLLAVDITAEHMAEKMKYFR